MSSPSVCIAGGALDVCLVAQHSEQRTYCILCIRRFKSLEIPPLEQYPLSEVGPHFRQLACVSLQGDSLTC